MPKSALDGARAALGDIAQLSDTRSAADALSIAGPQAVAWYTKSIGGLLGSLAPVAQSTEEADMAAQIWAVQAFSQAKERAGRERAQLSGAPAADWTPPTARRHAGGTPRRGRWTLEGMTTFLDGTGAAVTLSAPPRRVVSLVPSLTEALAASLPLNALMGATDWCTHPAGLTVPRFGGTKNPDVAGIVSARPDLVVANEEENKPEHVTALRAAGVSVWVTDIRTVAGALAEIGVLLDALAAPDRGWLAQAERSWAAAGPVVSSRTVAAVIPIWRKPWMFVGPDTYAGDVLARLGVRNVLGSSPGADVSGRHAGDLGAAVRYPRRDLTELPPYELVVLPDEPYRFTARDGPEAFAPAPCALVDGRSLTWYGPAMVSAPVILTAALRAALSRDVPS